MRELKWHPERFATFKYWSARSGRFLAEIGKATQGRYVWLIKRTDRNGRVIDDRVASDSAASLQAAKRMVAKYIAYLST